MEVFINNETIVTQARNLEELIIEQFAEPKGIAAAVGTTVIPRSRWAETPLTDSEKVAIIRATRGG